ncbi:MAG: hypothetical protein Aurels2KO_35110 [Aureliella sp.]
MLKLPKIMKFDDLRSRLRSVTSLFSVAVASGVAVPAALLADDTTGADGSVSIRLLLEPSSPNGEDQPPAGKELVEDTEAAQKPAVPSIAPKSLVANAVEISQSLAVRQPVDGRTPQPEPLVLDLDADLESNQIADQTSARESTSGDGAERKIEALPIATPARRLFGRRSQEPAKQTAPQRVTRRPSHPGAEPAPLPPGHDVLSLESANGALPSATKSSRGTQSSQLHDVEQLDLQTNDQLKLIDSEPLAAKVIDLDALDEEVTSKSTRREDEDSGAECPGSPDGIRLHLDSRAEDIPLEQSEHPYDAPKAKSSEGPKRLEKLMEVDDEFTAREKAIHRGINDCLHYFIANPENVVRRGPWALMHATLPFGVEAEIIAGKRRVNAIGWMCFNGVCARQRMFQPTRTGFRTNLGPGVQGHEGQFLAILAQSQVSASYPLQIGKKRYTVQDLVRYEMATCREKSELTFKLIGLSHYLPQDAKWRDSRRRVWNLEKMVAEELAQPVIGAACGGTHRLMGLTYAVMQRQRDGLPMTGHWARAEKFLQDYIGYALTLQNPDGSFSTDWFEGRAFDRDAERGVQTTGHILEWLIYSLPDEHLRSPKIQAAVEYLIKTVGRNPSHDWPIGPRGHALRALALYNQRVFGAEVGQMAEHIARNRSTVKLR